MDVQKQGLRMDALIPVAGTSAAKHMDVRERRLYMDVLIPVPGTSPAKHMDAQKQGLRMGALISARPRVSRRVCSGNTIARASCEVIC